MTGIETLREKLHAAIDSGDLQQIMTISVELDRAIIRLMQEGVHKPGHPRDPDAMNEKESTRKELYK